MWGAFATEVPGELSRIDHKIVEFFLVLPFGFLGGPSEYQVFAQAAKFAASGQVIGPKLVASVAKDISLIVSIVRHPPAKFWLGRGVNRTSAAFNDARH